VPAVVGWSPAAVAAPFNCGQQFGVTKPAPSRDQLPGIADGIETPTGDDAFYDYQNNAEPLRGMPAPSAEDRIVAGSDPSKWPAGSRNHAIARFRKYVENKAAKGKTALPWDKWLKQYVPNQGNANRGTAYEKFGAQQIGLNGPNWTCQTGIPDAGEERVYDAVNTDQKIAYEFKSGTTIDPKQLAKDQRIAARTGYKIVYIFGQEPTPATIKKLQAAGIGYHKLKATARVFTSPPTNPNPTPVEVPESQLLSPDKQTPSRGALPDYLGRGGADAEEAALVQEVDEELAIESGAAEQRLLRPGGVDFTTMELRYVQDTGDGNLQYAFNTKDLPEDKVSAGGLAVGQLTSDSFFTWLALPADSFWVNLNPTQPDQIIDSRLGATDAGRILLEADLTMKKFTAKLTDPATPLGAQFWDGLQLGPEQPPIPCFAARNWIVPDAATVREEGGQLFIVKAPLQVKSAPGTTAIPVGSSFNACQQDPPAVIKHNQELFESLILPKVQEEVNTGPEFEDLRRVYLSRVAAEWIRERAKGRHTAFSSIIDSGDVHRWKARVAWDPKEVYGRYLDSVNRGEYHTKHTFLQTGNPVEAIVSLGGVDFSKTHRDNLTPAAFKAAAPNLPVTVNSSRFADRHDQDGEHTWLGGDATRPRAAPAPVPGGLPITGGPVAALISAGGLLVAIGVALALWLQRRRQTIQFRA
jgi:hypothetical protein